jgi:LPPG:FO 2-phospho-L-lactate transferase
MNVTVLTGGGGGARLVAGLADVVDELTVVVNTGDDEVMRGLHISPDVDTVLYYLADLVDRQRGWGLVKESFAANDRYRELVVGSGVTVDMQDWFTLGDRDLATHMFRTQLLASGATLSEATAALGRALGISVHVLPMSDEPQRTVLTASSGETLGFQTYFVRHRHGDEVTAVTYLGSGRPAPGVIEALRDADVVVIGPSNPMLSIGPILALDGVRDALHDVVAVSPIVGGRAIKGPTDRLLASLGHEVSCVGVSRIYAGVADAFVIDEVDADRANEIEMRTIVCDTMMPGQDEATRVAREIIDAL